MNEKESDVYKKDQNESEKSVKNLKRIIGNTKIPNLLEVLTEKIGFTDLQSLLLNVYERKVKQLHIKDIVKQHLESRFVQPSDVNQREIIKFDNLIYSKIPPDFEAIELSPVGPLGANKVLSKLSQKNTLSTVRNIEVLADPTVILSLECARKRKILLHKNPLNSENVNLCTSHRMVRLQQFEKETGFTPHFRAFAMCTAGRDVGFEKFEIENLTKHLSIYLDLLESFNKNGYFAHDIEVAISDIRITETLISYHGINRVELAKKTQSRSFNLFQQYNIHLPENIIDLEGDLTKENISKYGYGMKKSVELLSKIKKEVVDPLKPSYPRVNFRFDLSRIAGIGYYNSLCFKISAKNKEQISFPLVDGGLSDWTQKLLNSRKERLLTSGVGSEFFCRNFKR